MKKTILITGATDGIGLETAKLLVADGYDLLLHGRNPGKLKSVAESLSSKSNGGSIETYLADFSKMAEVESMAKSISGKHHHLDILINNAGVYNSPEPVTPDGLDIRFAVNTIAPWLLTRRLLPLFDADGRIVNLSSAAQAPVDLVALAGGRALSAGQAYAQSKLALTMWSRALAQAVGGGAPSIIAVNPGSLLASKMVKDAFGVDGSDLKIGANILKRAALSDEFSDASGKYFDNDSRQFARPHPDALSEQKCGEVVQVIKEILGQIAKTG